MSLKLGLTFFASYLFVFASPSGCSDTKKNRNSEVEQYRIILSGVDKENQTLCEVKGLFENTRTMLSELKKDQIFLRDSLMSILKIYARRLLVAYKEFKSSNQKFPIKCAYLTIDMKNCYWHTIVFEDKIDFEIKDLEYVIQSK